MTLGNAIYHALYRKAEPPRGRDHLPIKNRFTFLKNLEGQSESRIPILPIMQHIVYILFVFQIHEYRKNTGKK